MRLSELTDNDLNAIEEVARELCERVQIQIDRYKGIYPTHDLESLLSKAGWVIEVMLDEKGAR